jgi:hypothetical protein
MTLTWPLGGGDVKQPWLGPPWIFEWEAALCGKLLAVVLLSLCSGGTGD